MPLSAGSQTRYSWQGENTQIPNKGGSTCSLKKKKKADDFSVKTIEDEGVKGKYTH